MDYSYGVHFAGGANGSASVDSGLSQSQPSPQDFAGGANAEKAPYVYKVVSYNFAEFAGGANGITGEDVLVQKYMTKELREWCEKMLAKFYFIKWDRFIRTKMVDGPYMLTCYGWIDREQDSYKDFVVIDLVLDNKRVNYVVSSSAKYSKQICGLCGYKSDLHKNCVRIEDVFSVPNEIKLALKNEAEK